VVRGPLHLVVYNRTDEPIPLEHIAEMLRHAFGFDYTQALNCASVIVNKGRYIVKTFQSKEAKKALAYETLLNDQGLPAIVVSARSW